MNVLTPKEYTFVSSSVPATTEIEYNVATTYAIGDLVKLETEHHTYKSLSASNVGNDPLTDTINWLDLGATNRWKMFDALVNSETENPLTIDATVNTSNASTLALFGLSGHEVQIIVTDATTATEVFNQVFDLTGPESTSWSDYFFKTTDIIEDATLDVSIPIYFNQDIRIIITSLITAKCGQVVMGRTMELGAVQYGAGVGIADYSRKQTNDFGDTYLAQGNFAKTTSIDLVVYNNKLDSLLKKLISLRAVPAVWKGSNDSNYYNALFVYGFYKRFDVIISGYEVSHCSLEVEGLT